MDSLFVPLLIGCALALASALGVALARRPIYAAISLLVHSLSLAALFAILAAPMVAIGQVIIYSGAIVVLFLFVVTLLPSGGSEFKLDRNRVALAVVAGGGLLVALAIGLSAGSLPVPTAAFDLSIQAVGHALFGPLLVPFELTAPLLLVAIIGAIVIWRRHDPDARTAPAPTRQTEPRRLVMHR